MLVGWSGGGLQEYSHGSGSLNLGTYGVAPRTGMDVVPLGDSREQGGEEALITCGFLVIGMEMSLEIHLVLLLLTSSRGT